jgi:thiamine-phosphate pyrophosphorylase
MVNRRIDVALAIGADGVQLGFDAVDVATAREVLGVGPRIGVSTHSCEEVARAAAQGADHVQLAAIFDPRSKPATRPALGVGTLRTAASLGASVIAQGGIDARRCAEVIAAGACGVAVTGAILMASDPADATASLRRALDD